MVKSSDKISDIWLSLTVQLIMIGRCLNECHTRTFPGEDAQDFRSITLHSVKVVYSLIYTLKNAQDKTTELIGIRRKGRRGLKGYVPFRKSLIEWFLGEN